MRIAEVFLKRSHDPVCLDSLRRTLSAMVVAVLHTLLESGSSCFFAALMSRSFEVTPAHSTSNKQNVNAFDVLQESRRIENTYGMGTSPSMYEKCNNRDTRNNDVKCDARTLPLAPHASDTACMPHGFHLSQALAHTPIPGGEARENIASWTVSSRTLRPTGRHCRGLAPAAHRASS